MLRSSLPIHAVIKVFIAESSPAISGYQETMQTRDPRFQEVVAHNKKTILYVGGLEDVVTEEVLRDVFVAFGEIVQVLMPADAATGKHRGFGFVEFEETEDAQHAMDNMNDSELFGRVIKVNVARPNAIKAQAVWAEADQWYANKLKGSAAEVNQQIRQEEAKPEKKEDDPFAPIIKVRRTRICMGCNKMNCRDCSSVAPGDEDVPVSSGVDLD